MVTLFSFFGQKGLKMQIWGHKKRESSHPLTTIEKMAPLLEIKGWRLPLQGWKVAPHS